MSQLMACLNDHGIILASDSKAVDFNSSGEILELTVNRLMPLSHHTAIMAGGAAEGIAICQSLKNFIVDEGLNDVQAVYNAALPFLATEFDKFMRRRCETLPIDPIHHVYFILGGYTPKAPTRPFRLYLLWTKKKLPQLDGDEISVAYTVPRIIGLEHKLNQLCRQNSPLDTILLEIKRGMKTQSEKNEEIGPPFYYSFITQDGYQQTA
jgi:hypothetical protein